MAGPVQYVPGLEYGENGQKRVLVHRNRENAIPDQETWHRDPAREDAGC